MLEVGHTGGIACGKSIVLRRLHEHGAATLDADRVVHGLMTPGTATTRAVAEEFGKEVLSSDGSVNRKALGAIVFSDEARRQALNAIVHPEVWRGIDRFFETAASEGRQVGVVDAALMIETGSYDRYQRLVVVFCPRELQVKRLRERDGISMEDAQMRIDAQMPVEEKRTYADYVIDTSTSIESTLAQTDDLWKKLLAEGRAREKT